MVLAEEFLEYFDGFSIGSDDMTQTLGPRSTSGLIAHSFDERNPAVLKMLDMAITACRRPASTWVSRQGPSDHPDLAKWLPTADVASR